MNVSMKSISPVILLMDCLSSFTIHFQFILYIFLLPAPLQPWWTFHYELTQFTVIRLVMRVRFLQFCAGRGWSWHDYKERGKNEWVIVTIIIAKDDFLLDNKLSLCALAFVFLRFFSSSSDISFLICYCGLCLRLF